MDASSSVKCPKGYYCEQNVQAAVICADGYYQPNEQQGSCLECPEGFYCEKNPAPVDAKLCPKGKYCPKRSLAATDCG